MVGGINCFINQHTISTLHRDHGENPGIYMGALLKELVPEEVLSLPYVTARGKRPGTVALPSQLYKCVKGWYSTL